MFAQNRQQVWQVQQAFIATPLGWPSHCSVTVVRDSSTEFNENLTNGLLAETRSQTDGQTGFCFVNTADSWAAAGWSTSLCRNCAVQQGTLLCAWRPCAGCRLTTEEPCIDPRQEIFLFSSSWTHPSTRTVGTVGFLPVVRRPGRDPENSPPSSTEITNDWSDTSTPTISPYRA